MSDLTKVFAQVNPSAITLTDAYTVPVGKKVVLTPIIANRGAMTTFRLSVGVNGAADDPKQYVFYDTRIVDNDTIHGPRLSLAAGDVVRVYATDARLTFTLTGLEVT